MEVVGFQEGFHNGVVMGGVCIEEEEDLMASCFKWGKEGGEVIEDLLALVRVVDAASAKMPPLLHGQCFVSASCNVFLGNSVGSNEY